MSYGYMQEKGRPSRFHSSASTACLLRTLDKWLWVLVYSPVNRAYLTHRTTKWDNLYTQSRAWHVIILTRSPILPGWHICCIDFQQLRHTGMPIITVALRGCVTLAQTPPVASYHTWNQLPSLCRDPAWAGPRSDLTASLDTLSHVNHQP